MEIRLSMTGKHFSLSLSSQGRPTEATVELKSKKYGEVDARDYIPGAEVLLQNDTEVKTCTKQMSHFGNIL